MHLQELQEWVQADWKNRSHHQPSIELQLLYIIEELGEVAEAIRKTNGKKTRKEAPVDLGSEIADLLVSITTLANTFSIDLTAELQKFQQRIAERHAAGH